MQIHANPDFTKKLLMAPNTTSLFDRSFSVANWSVSGCLLKLWGTWNLPEREVWMSIIDHNSGNNNGSNHDNL